MKLLMKETSFNVHGHDYQSFLLGPFLQLVTTVGGIKKVTFPFRLNGIRPVLFAVQFPFCTRKRSN